MIYQTHNESISTPHKKIKHKNYSYHVAERPFVCVRMRACLPARKCFNQLQIGHHCYPYFLFRGNKNSNSEGCIAIIANDTERLFGIQTISNWRMANRKKWNEAYGVTVCVFVCDKFIYIIKLNFCGKRKHSIKFWNIVHQFSLSRQRLAPSWIYSRSIPWNKKRINPNALFVLCVVAFFCCCWCILLVVTTSDKLH